MGGLLVGRDTAHVSLFEPITPAGAFDCAPGRTLRGCTARSGGKRLRGVSAEGRRSIRCSRGENPHAIIARVNRGRLKVTTVLGTRPEIIRLSRVIAALDAATYHVLVHTGQNYDDELNGVFFDLEIRRPDHFLEAAGSTAAETIGQVIIRIDRVLAETQPDALLVLGDTNSALAAIAAKRRRVAVFHMEAGNRCFDDRVPEEINRRLVDHIADVNLPYSSIAREYLLREGFPPDRIVKTGSPMVEVLEHYRDKIARSDVLARLGLEPERYFVVSAHREENVDSPVNLRALAAVLDAVASDSGLRVIFSAHPRTRNARSGRTGVFTRGRGDDRTGLHRLCGAADTRGCCPQQDRHRRVVHPELSGAEHREAERPEGMEERLRS